MVKSTTLTAPAFSQHQLVRDFQELCAPRQRALLSLLAICHKHDLHPAPLVESLSRDLPRTPLESRRKTRKFFWSRVRDSSEELKQYQTLPEGLETFYGLLPDTVGLALRLEQNQGTLGELNDAWLNRQPDHVYDVTRDDSFVARMAPLFLKTFIILMLSTFILLFVIPQFKYMLEEFGVAAPPIFQLTMKIIDTAVKFSFVPILLFLVAIPFCFRSLVRYFRRWNPFVWRQPWLPSAVSTRQALALVTRYGKLNFTNELTRFTKLQQALECKDGDNGANSEKQISWKELASQNFISNKEAQALEMADSGAVQAWLLQNTATTQHRRIESRGMFFTRSVVTIVNVILCILVLLLALSVFATLISVMSHLY